MKTVYIIGVVGIVLVGMLFFWGWRPSEEEVRVVEKETMSPLPEASKPTPESPKAAAITPIHEKVSVTLQTSKGEIGLELDGTAAPMTVGNFVKLANDGFYDGVIFHRVIKGFMIQGGDPTGTGTGGPGYMFADEINPNKITRGAIAMANAGPNTNGSQFFIVTAETTPHLDGLHTYFGKVVSGMDVVDAIEATETGANDKPVTPVVIEGVVVAE